MIGLLLMLTLMLASVSTAQDIPVFCGTLSADDCAILERSQEAMKSIDSASTTFDLSINISGVPDLPTESLVITLTGSGSFANGGAFNAMTDISEDTEITTLLNMLAEGLKAFNGDLVLNLSIPSEVTGGELPDTITLHLMLVDGVGYIDFDPLQPITNDPSLVGWGGIDIANLLVDLVAQQGDMLNDPEIAGAFAEGFAMGATGGAEFASTEAMGQFIAIERVADENGAAVFESTVDLSALSRSPEFQEIIRQQMEAQGQTMTDAEFSQALSITEVAFQDSSVVVRQAIDPATGYVVSTNGSMSFDLTTIGAMSGEGVAPIISINFTVNTSGVNATSAVSAPAGASLFPYQMLLGMMSQGMSQ